MSESVTEPSPEDLREAYERLQQLEDMESTLNQQLRELRNEKGTLKLNFIKYMESTDLGKLQIRGSANSLEIVESRKTETLTRDTLRKRIVDFFATEGCRDSFRSLNPRQQCEQIITNVFDRREVCVVRKLKHIVDKNQQRLKSEIQSIPIPVSSELPSTSSASGSSGSSYRRIVRKTS